MYFAMNGPPTAKSYSMNHRSRGKIVVLWVPLCISLWFSYSYALKYLTREPEQYGIYIARHDWLYAHIIAGLFALLLGPAQLYLGLNERTAIVHRVMGVTYVLAVMAGGTAAFYLAAYNDFGWVFTFGFGSMAAAWMITTILATIAICLRQKEQHREWMIRSYVVTFGFVFFRVLFEAFDMAKLGTIVERKTAAVWLAWAVPLFITETVLQARKIFAPRPKLVPVQSAQSYTIAHEPVRLQVEPEAPTQGLS